MAPPGISSSCISLLTSSGQRSRASWASQPQKSDTLSPQPGGKPRKFIRTCGGIAGRKKEKKKKKPLRNIQQPTHAHTPKWRKLPTLLQKLRFSQRCYWMFQYSGVLRLTDWNTVTDVAKEWRAFIFGIRQSLLSPLFKVFHRQRTIISSYLPYFIHSYQLPHFRKSGWATDMYSRKTGQ